MHMIWSVCIGTCIWNNSLIFLGWMLIFVFICLWTKPFTSKIKCEVYNFFSVFKEKSVKDYWEKMLSDSYCSAKELHRETIAKIALLYQNSSI